ncbi:hypothetical protein QYZ88_016885 [Lachnospiraceae bacterium C1.1]|nr:hypothetical protein [Lachnospiraceae bacterium C1.1]
MKQILSRGLAVAFSSILFTTSVAAAPGGSSSSPTWSGATTITSSITTNDQTYSSTTADQNALLINTDGAVTINNPTVTKSGGTSASDDYSFYGINSAVMCKGGGTTTITGGSVNTTAAGANGVFSYGANNGTTNATGDGTTVKISDMTITTTGNGSGGIMTTYGGTTIADDLTITTAGGSSAPIRTDRGGGWVTVDGGTYTSNGQGSPAIYSTADVEVSNATLISNKSEGVCIEGTGSIELTDCSLTANNTSLNGNATFYDTIMIYQSQSGDASDGTSSFTMTNGSLTSKKGHTFHVTNTTATIALEDVDITNSSDDVLISVCDDGWSGASNVATLTATDQDLSGDVLVGSDSTLTMVLSDDSSFEGKTSGVISNGKGSSVSTTIGTVNMTIGSGCSWELTGNSYVTSLTNNGSIDTNGYTLYVNGNAYDGTDDDDDDDDDDDNSNNNSSNNSSSSSDSTQSSNTFVGSEKLNISTLMGSLSNVKYKSSNKKIAKVSKKGIVTFKKTAGTVVISAIDKSTKSTVSSVSLDVKVPSFTQKKLELSSSGSVSVNLYNYLSADGISESPTWISSKPSVASVDSSTGVLTVKGTGSAKIYAVYGASTTSDKMGSRKKYKIKIKVK